ncbi:MAG: hypothetical protein LUE65_01970 [Clostridiales bacterium]|nr:hypothetical protein [Clostridiales bacterium]
MKGIVNISVVCMAACVLCGCGVQRRVEDGIENVIRNAIEKEENYETAFVVPDEADHKDEETAETESVSEAEDTGTRNQWSCKDEQWYYYDSDGNQATGWQEIEEKWYYFDEDGVMAHDEWVEDCYLGSDGKWMQEMQSAPNKECTDGYSNVMMRFHSDGDSSHRVTSQATKRNGYYEITNVEMYVHSILPKEKVEQLKIGDTVPKYGGIYVLKRIYTDPEGLKSYNFEPEDGWGSRYGLWECDEGYYQVSDSDFIEEKIVYTGIIYMSEDCVVSSLDYTRDPDRGIDDLTVLSVEQLINKEFIGDIGGGQGFVTLDSGGIVIEYNEYFQS